jgi:hypothetical protein
LLAGNGFNDRTIRPSSKNGPVQDTSLTPEPDNAFSTQLESLMGHDFFGDVPVSVVRAAQYDLKTH